MWLMNIKSQLLQCNIGTIQSNDIFSACMTYIQDALMGTLCWLVAVTSMRERCRCVEMTNGEQSAIAAGTIERLRWYVGSWDMMIMVSIRYNDTIVQQFFACTVFLWILQVGLWSQNKTAISGHSSFTCESDGSTIYRSLYTWHMYVIILRV